MSARETILTALHARLSMLPATALRGFFLKSSPILLLLCCLQALRVQGLSKRCYGRRRLLSQRAFGLMRNLPSIFAPDSTEIFSAEMSALIWALDLIIISIAATVPSILPSIVTVFARVFPINLPVFFMIKTSALRLPMSDPPNSTIPSLVQSPRITMPSFKTERRLSANGVLSAGGA